MYFLYSISESALSIQCLDSVLFEQFHYISHLCWRWPAMCIHGDKSQPERDWVLTGEWHLHFLLVCVLVCGWLQTRQSGFFCVLTKMLCCLLSRLLCCLLTKLLCKLCISHYCFDFFRIPQWPSTHLGSDWRGVPWSRFVLRLTVSVLLCIKNSYRRSVINIALVCHQ